MGIMKMKYNIIPVGFYLCCLLTACGNAPAASNTDILSSEDMATPQLTAPLQDTVFLYGMPEELEEGPGQPLSTQSEPIMME